MIGLQQVRDQVFDTKSRELVCDHVCDQQELVFDQVCDLLDWWNAAFIGVYSFNGLVER